MIQYGQDTSGNGRKGVRVGETGLAAARGRVKQRNGLQSELSKMICNTKKI